MRRGLCFESALPFTNTATSTVVPASGLVYFPTVGGAAAGGTTLPWTGPLYMCVEDKAASKTTAAGVAQVQTYSTASNFYSAKQLCIQALTVGAVTGSSGTDPFSTIYALAGVGGKEDTFVWAWQKSCAVKQRVWSCSAYVPGTSCELTAACAVIATGSTTDPTAVSASSSASAVKSGGGYLYFCLQDTSESDSYAWFPTQYCVQTLVVSGVTSNRGATSTFAAAAGSAVDTVIVSWSRTCATQHSIYDCGAVDLTKRCSTSSLCSLSGTSNTNSFAIAATSLQAGNRLVFSSQHAAKLKQT